MNYFGTSFIICVFSFQNRKDARYNDELSRITGYHVETLLCMPIRNGDNEIVGVAQALNKNSETDTVFTLDDEKMLATYLTFCGIGIHNAQIFDAYSKEYERNRVSYQLFHWPENDFHLQ
ncbi:cGMP-specific 3',5'-cyclic phosphodiesterase [Elysia marginata]|uniref:cGMP-specific 3',5'-cyclic phosphodiesterase n=1 Tax=Elysia marginata TaxID=1093978 RepID=A0AAV4IDG0_9GAST|nr:cGMP-specific 3',5'-cyclic phosphodiesterase [Elysia marginata]